MRAPVWDTDAAADLPRIGANARALVIELRASAADRLMPDLETACDWHRQLCAGCTVPVAGYLGHFRGDQSVPQLVGYEVGVGPPQRDRLPERVGVWSHRLAAELPVLVSRIQSGLAHLDEAFGPAERPSTPDGVDAIVQLAAAAHGEWLRCHPFANGNGRTARVWANFIALRYGLPAFVAVKPRPDHVSYARAGRESMGRPPNFLGDHSATAAVFTRMLAQSLEA